jgi:PAS domain S-box-containing protein
VSPGNLSKIFLTRKNGSNSQLPFTILKIILLITVIGFFLTLLFFYSPSDPGDADRVSGYRPVNLTTEELQWIKDHPVALVCPDPGYPPFERITENGEYQGVSADLLREISSITNLKIDVVHEPKWSECVEKVKAGSADILGAVYISSLRDEYLIYSVPYYRSLLPIITRKTSDSEITLEKLSGKQVASVKGFTTTLLLKKKYPEIIIVEVPDVKTGLEQVSLGTVDAYFGDLAASTWYVDEAGISNLHVAGSYEPENPDEFSYAFGIRKDKPELAQILNKGLDAIPKERRDEIIRKWISPTLTQAPLNPIIFMIIAGAIGLLLLITLGFIIWNRTLRQAVSIKTLDLTYELIEHKKTADALQMTRFTVDHSHTMMLWFDREGIIYDVNKTVSNISGYCREDLIGQHITLLDANLFQEHLTRILSQIQTKERVIRETTIQCKNGKIIPVLEMIWHFTFEGEEWFYTEIEDISEKIAREKYIKESEENYRSLFHHINDAIILYNITSDGMFGRILDANEMAEKMTGYPHEQLCSMPYVHLGIVPHPDIRDLNPFGCTSGRCSFEWEIITASAEIIPVEVNLHVFEREELHFGLSLIRDVTEKKMFEAERVATINQIQKNLAELSLLNDGIRNPLSIILSTSELYCPDAFSQIEKQVLRIDDMIKQLDKRWNESEKILTYLKKHHGVVIQKNQKSEKPEPTTKK